jgi:hypothetical protein
LNYFRLQAEQNYKAVEILVDYDELVSLASSNGLALEELSRRFKEAGATGVVARERTLQELHEGGHIAMFKGAEANLLQLTSSMEFNSLEYKKGDTFIITDNRTVYEMINKELEAINKDFSSENEGNTYIISVHVTEKEIEKLGFGFIYEDLEAMNKGGLDIVPRLREYAKSTEEAIDLMEEKLVRIPSLQMIAFNDPAILGAGNIPYMAEKLEKLDVPVGMFEFYHQAGIKQLALQTGKNIVRVHSISESDMGNYNERQAADRYRLAVSERNIRSLYVRLFGLEHPSTAIDRGLNYMSLLRNGMIEEGFTIGDPEPLASIPYSRIVMFVIGLGVIGAGLLLLELFTTGLWSIVVGILAILGWGSLLFIDPLLARKTFALLSVIVYPVMSIISILREKQRSIFEAVIALLKMSVLSLIGAVIMTGLLADKSFMLTLDIFSGVKLAHLLPLLLIPAYFILKGTNPVKEIREILNYPVLNKHVILGLFLIAALGIYIIRTGNQAPQLVSSWETALRDLLDQVLGVRPRTKEFLIGHPAMLLLLYYGYDMRKIAVLLIAIIGQVSLVNTYAHIHTPLIISLIRTLHGLWIGIIIGVIVIICLNYLLKWLRTKGALEGE